MSRFDALTRCCTLLLLSLGAASCGGRGGGDAAQTPGAAGSAGGAQTASPAAAPAGGAAAAAAALTDADLDAYERGIAREIELVKAAQEGERTATTPQARGEAMQAQWKEQTMPAGAQSAGLPPERYRDVRETVNRVLETLDFQGKIDGPLSMDTARATPEMRQRLASDPFAALPPASAAAIRGRLDRLARLWGDYVKLTAVAG